MADLHINIQVHIEQPGPNPRWNYSTEVQIPPDYHDVDIEPFVLHEIDKAVTAHQREHFGESRSAEIIHQFDMRMRIIESLLKFAPHDLTRVALAAAILKVIHADREELFSTYARAELED